MNNNFVFWTGIIGVTLFVIASVLGGFQFENYSHLSQFISESMAIDTPYGKLLRYFGYIPSGVLLTVFSLAAISKFPKSNLVRNGFIGLAIFYGIATIVVGIFPCDSGCNKEFIDPSISQIIHNLSGFLTYIFVPISLIMIGAGLRQFNQHLRLSGLSFVCGVICIFFNGLLMFNPESNYVGLLQRVIEATIIVWVIACAAGVNRKIEFNTE
jgi:uncharacterized membrane protein